MKTLKKYQCDMCGTIYDDVELAVSCENSHVFETGIVETSYNSNAKYPWKIVVEFTDGKRIQYKRTKDPISENEEVPDV